MKVVRKAHIPRKPDDKLPLFDGLHYEYHTTQAFDWRGPRWEASLRCVADIFEINKYLCVFKPSESLLQRQLARAGQVRSLRTDIIPRPVWCAMSNAHGLSYLVFRTVRKGEV